MEYKNLKRNLPIKQNNLSDPDERARVLRKYAGIFPNNIVEYGNRVLKRHKAQKNYSK